METLQKIKVLLGMEVTPTEMEEAKEQMKFEDIALEDGTIVSADALEVGSAVFIMVEEEKQPLPVGEYALAEFETLKGEYSAVKAESKVLESKVSEFEKVGEEIKPNPEGNFKSVQLTPLEFSKLSSHGKVQYRINQNKK